MKKQLITFLGAGALAAGMAFAQTSAATAPSNQPSTVTQGTHRNMMQKRLNRLTRELNLTASQQSQAKSIFSASRQEAMPVRTQLKQNTQALRAAVKSDNTAQINQLSAKEGSLIGQMVTIRSDSGAKFYQTLNPEQRVKFDQLHQQARARFHNRLHQQAQTNG
jgi:Spy/CpxP family protein refolding chaperone